MHPASRIPPLLGLAACLILAPACRKSEHGTPTPRTETTPPNPDGWIPMDGIANGKWTPIDGATDVQWKSESQSLWIDFGHELNGVRWIGPLPTAPYEIELDARRLSGSDFFCALTFPVRSESECVTFIVGGWGGNLVGISSIDGRDASENSTASSQNFDDNRWYRIKVRVEPHRLQAWIDDRNMVSLDITETELSLREGPIRDCAPLGLATYATRGEIRSIRWRKIND